MPRLCVDFGGTNIKMGLADGGEVLRSVEFPVGGSAADLDAIMAAAVRLGADATEVDAVAMAVPGLIDPGRSRLVLAHGKYDWMTGVDLAAWARDAFGASAVVENDARAALLGEAASGAARGARDAAILVLGTGIGTAVMADGRLLLGPSGAGGNLAGHTTIDWRGPVCNCGNIGCAEVFGGSWALPDRIADVVGSGAGEESEHWRARLDAADAIGFAEVFERAAAGDPVAVQVRDQAIRAWSVVAVTYTHVVAPEVIVISGGVARAAAEVIPAMRAYVREHIWRVLDVPRFVVADDPANSVLRGLAVR
ncbi:ROK family protein [Microbacterium cremeum]|uniref:ROK family protein n=1 Tax=Microbacterium cremeum TaxID=2782169 RepID=UPI0018874F92|nr:ROK family protein [Microbacterium cremeum]